MFEILSTSLLPNLYDQIESNLFEVLLGVIFFECLGWNIQQPVRLSSTDLSF